MAHNRHPWIDDRLPQLLESARQRWPALDLSKITVIRGSAVVPVYPVPILNFRMGYDPQTHTLVILDP
jgi:hypothetical protein